MKQLGRPTRFRWVVFTLACGTSWLLYLHRYSFALIKPQLQQEWQLGKDQLGLLDSAFSLCYSLFQVPLGVMADLAGVHLVLSGLIIVWSIGLAMHAWAPSLGALWLARATFGVGQSATYASLSRITRSWFPRSVRTTVQGWVGVFFGRIGGLCCYLLVGTLMLGVWGMPWRTAIWLLAAAGLLHGVAFAVLFRNSPDSHPAVNQAERKLIEEGPEDALTGRRMSFREMFNSMSGRSILNLSFLNAQTILSTLADNIYSAWIPLFLFEVHGLKFREMGIYSALPLLGGALGGAAGGWLNDLLIAQTGSRRWSRSGVGLAGKGVAGLMLAAALLVYDNPRLFCLVLFGVKFFSDWSLVTTWGAVTDIGGRATATVFAFNNAIAGVGSVLGPALYGGLAEYYGWRPVFLTAAGTYLACALSWIAFNCTIPIMREDKGLPMP